MNKIADSWADCELRYNGLGQWLDNARLMDTPLGVLIGAGKQLEATSGG